MRGPRRGPRHGPGLLAVILLIACAPEASPDSAPDSLPADPSFDCGRAEGEVERLICTDGELARLDRQLDSVWTRVQSRMAEGDMPPGDRDRIRAEQRGWIRGRNECWKADDPRRCVVESYRRRAVALEAGFGLVEAGPTTFWSCRGTPADEFVVTFFETDPPSARVERGDGSDVMVAEPAASGTRYVGSFGRQAWLRGDEATFVWPQGDTVPCRLRDGGG